MAAPLGTDCPITEADLRQLLKLKKMLNIQSYSSLFNGTLEDILSNTLGKKLFGDLSLDGLPDISEIQKQIEGLQAAQLKLLEDVQRALAEGTGLLEDQINDILKGLSGRIDNRLAWLINAQKFVQDRMDAFKTCREALQRYQTQNNSPSISETVENNISEYKRELESVGITNSNRAIQEVGLEKLDVSYKSMKYLDTERPII